MSAALPLSVVMPARNVGSFVDAAVESILSQSYADFEFVILDDGSGDDTHDRLRAWETRDARIRLFRSRARLGPAGSSNFVVEHARAPLIARMDADDVAHPQRLARQIAFVVDRPGMTMVGTLSDTIDAAGKTVRPADQGRLLRASAMAPFSHSSILFRRAAFDSVGGYRRAADKWEDIDLFLRLADAGAVYVLRQVLMHNRQSSASTRIADGSDALEQAMERLHRCLDAYRNGHDYTVLMEVEPERLSSDSFIAAASGSMWAEQGSHYSRRLHARVERPEMAVTLWAVLADASPGLLQAVLRTRLLVRNAIAAVWLCGRTHVRWRPQDSCSRSA